MTVVLRDDLDDVCTASTRTATRTTLAGRPDALDTGDPVNRVDYTGRSSDALKWFFTGVLAAEAPLVLPALASTGILGLCILMALTLDDDLPDEDDAPPSSNECMAKYYVDRAVCSRLAVSNYGKRVCYESASERLASCLKGKRLPDLITWVN